MRARVYILLLAFPWFLVLIYGLGSIVVDYNSFTQQKREESIRVSEAIDQFESASSALIRELDIIYSQFRSLDEQSSIKASIDKVRIISKETKADIQRLKTRFFRKVKRDLTAGLQHMVDLEDNIELLFKLKVQLFETEKQLRTLPTTTYGFRQTPPSYFGFDLFSFLAQQDKLAQMESLTRRLKRDIEEIKSNIEVIRDRANQTADILQNLSAQAKKNYDKENALRYSDFFYEKLTEFSLKDSLKKLKVLRKS